MSSTADNLLECVSAKQLLQALTTLNHIAEEEPENDLELSFSHTSNSFFQPPKSMSFQMYMSKKNNLNTQKKKVNKSITPVKPSPKPNKMQEYKSRSHSPLPMSRTPKQKPKQNQSNKENQASIQTKSKISFQSKKILEEKGKKGSTYVPIHQRVTDLVKKKQQKIAKMQRMSNAYKQLEDKECTFKPTIQKWKKSKNPTITNRHKNGHTLTQTQVRQIIEVEAEETKIENTVQITERKPKYKNEKFNKLLDLIN